MISAQEYWFERFGAKVAPDAAHWREALMGTHPHFDPARKSLVRMGGSEPARFLISEGAVRVWAPIAPAVELPADTIIAPTSSRKRRDWLVDTIIDPPEPPFLAASVGMSSADAAFWRMTTSRDLIALGGAAALLEGVQSILVERTRFIEARDWFASEKVAISDLLRLGETRRLFQKELLTGAEARARLDRLKTDRAILDTYPGEDNPLLMKLASYAVTYWEAETA